MGLEPVAEEEEEAIHFEAIYFDLTNLLKRSAEPEASAVSGLSLDPQVYYQVYHIQRCPLQSTYSAYIESLNLTPTIASIYRSTAYTTFDLQPVLRLIYSLLALNLSSL